MLNVRGISAQYGRARVLSDVGFDVEEGEIVSVVGANGAGKSTLVRVISGMMRPTSGQIIFAAKTSRRVRHMKSYCSVLSMCPRAAACSVK